MISAGDEFGLLVWNGRRPERRSPRSAAGDSLSFGSASPVTDKPEAAQIVAAMLRIVAQDEGQRRVGADVDRLLETKHRLMIAIE